MLLQKVLLRKKTHNLVHRDVQRVLAEMRILLTDLVVLGIREADDGQCSSELLASCLWGDGDVHQGGHGEDGRLGLRGAVRVSEVRPRFAFGVLSECVSETHHGPFLCFFFRSKKKKQT